MEFANALFLEEMLALLACKRQNTFSRIFFLMSKVNKMKITILQEKKNHKIKLDAQTL